MFFSNHLFLQQNNFFFNIDEIIKSKNEILKSKDVLIKSQDELRKCNQDLLKWQENEIERLKTELAFKDGHLNARGILELCERTKCEYHMIGWPRLSKWRALCEKHPELLEFETQSSESYAQSIAVLYESLQSPFQSFYSKALYISDVTVSQAVILAKVCKLLGIKWRSDLIDQNMRRVVDDWNSTFSINQA